MPVVVVGDLRFVNGLLATGEAAALEALPATALLMQEAIDAGDALRLVAGIHDAEIRHEFLGRGAVAVIEGPEAVAHIDQLGKADAQSPRQQRARGIGEPGALRPPELRLLHIDMEGDEHGAEGQHERRVLFLWVEAVVLDGRLVLDERERLLRHARGDRDVREAKGLVPHGVQLAGVAHRDEETARDVAPLLLGIVGGPMMRALVFLARVRVMCAPVAHGLHLVELALLDLLVTEGAFVARLQAHGVHIEDLRLAIAQLRRPPQPASGRNAQREPAAAIGCRGELGEVIPIHADGFALAAQPFLGLRLLAKRGEALQLPALRALHVEVTLRAREEVAPREAAFERRRAVAEDLRRGPEQLGAHLGAFLGRRFVAREGRDLVLLIDDDQLAVETAEVRDAAGADQVELARLEDHRERLPCGLRGDAQRIGRGALADERLDFLSRHALRGLRRGIEPEDRAGPFDDLMQDGDDAEPQRAADARGFAQVEEAHARAVRDVQQIDPLGHEVHIHRARQRRADAAGDADFLGGELRDAARGLGRERVANHGLDERKRARVHGKHGEDRLGGDW